MASDEAELMTAVAGVLDPDLGIPIGEAGMIRAVRTRKSRAGVVLAVPVAAWPGEAEIRRLVEAAARGVRGIEEVSIEVGVMDDTERGALRRTLRQAMEEGPDPTDGGETADSAAETASGDGDGHGHGHGHGAAETPTPIFLRPESRTRVIGIASGKGGVGKSSVTVNLAVSLAAQGHRVGVLDADVYGFSIPKMMGTASEPIVLGDLVIPASAFGVRVLSMGYFVPDDQPVIWRGPMLHKAIEQFLADAWWGEPDFLLVDMPPGTGDVTLTLSQVMTRAEVVVVTTPQAAAQRVAQRAAYAARKLKLSVRGVVENMSWFTGVDGTRYELFGKGGGDTLAADLGVPLLGSVPLIPALREGGDEGTPEVVANPDGEAAHVFGELAARLASLGPARVYRRELALR